MYKRQHQHETAAVLHAGLQTRVGQALEAEGRLVEVRALLGVADVQFDVVGAKKWEEVGGSCHYFLQIGGDARDAHWFGSM